jgi:hypothetical protein
VEIPVFLALQSRVLDPDRFHSYRIQALKLHSYFAKVKCCGIHNKTAFKNTGILLIDGSLFATLFKLVGLEILCFVGGRFP